MKKVAMRPASRQKVSTASKTSVMMSPLVQPQDGDLKDVHARISALAYSLYEQRGRTHGHHIDDWLTAERQIIVGPLSASLDVQGN